MANDTIDLPKLGPTTGPVQVVSTGTIAAGTADSGNPIKVGGVRNTIAPTYTNGQRADLQVDTTGALFINTEGRKRAYSASINSLTVAALTTDFFTITGAASKIIRVKSLYLTGEATNNAVIEVVLLKRSTANSGGTSTDVAAVSHDSLDAAAEAVVRAYTANPTTGTLVGNVRGTDLFLPGTSGNPSQAWTISFVDTGRSLVLNSASEVLALNLVGVTTTGANYAVNITWTEE